jgi:capsular exopolysaccharide synthesis family protein
MNDAFNPEPRDTGGLPVPRPLGGRDLARPAARDALPIEWHQQAPGHVAEEPIDLVGYWHVLLKHWPVVLGAMALAVLVALASTLLTTKIYRATSTLQIDREALKVVEFQGDQRSVEGGSGTDFLQTQYELLRSRAIAQRVVSRIGAPGGSAGTAPGAPRDEAALQASKRGEVAAVMSGLTIEPVRNSRLVRVHFDSPDPVRAARVANAVGDAFIASTLERRFEASAYAKTYLEDRLAQLKTRLESSERDLVRFAQAERIVSGADGQSLSGQNLAELNTSLAQAQAQRIRAEARWRQASQSRGSNLPADMLAGSILHTLQDRRAQLEAQYQDKLGVYKAAFPAMVQLKGQIDELDRQISAELVGIRASVRSEYEAAQRQETLLASKMASIRGDELDLQSRSIRYNILKREVDTNRQLYDALLQRYKEIGVAGGVSTNNVSVVDRAEVPVAPFKPSLPRNLSLGLLAGLLLGVAAAFLREHADDTVRHPEQLEHLFGLAVLGTVPLLKAGHAPMSEAEDLRSGFSESYRSIRTALQFSTDAGVPRSLLVTSASPGEGKTTTALLLARNLAQLGQRVLLIDADLRNPSLHRLVTLTREEGLSNLLAGAATMESIVQPSGQDGLSVIRSGPLPPNPAELLASPRMRALLQSAMNRYDQVILDGPPIMGLADATLLAHLAEGTLLMVACGRTHRGVLRSALKRMAGARAHVIGAVLTMFDPRRTAFGYGDNAYEYYAYGTPTPKAIGRA